MYRASEVGWDNSELMQKYTANGTLASNTRTNVVIVAKKQVLGER